MRLSVVAPFCLAGILFVSNAYAQCDSALVKSTYVKTSSVSQMSQLADLVDSETYNEITHDGSGQATIYGVPVGANYSDFQNNVNIYKHDHTEKLSTSQLENIAWEGLDSNSPRAYRDCLIAQVLSSDGLHAAVISTSKSDISIIVRWNVPGTASSAHVSWTPAAISGSKLPQIIHQGTTIIRVLRPSQELDLSGNFNGYAAGPIKLFPYISIPPLHPPSLAATSVDFDGDGIRDDFSLLPRGFIIHLGNGHDVATPVVSPDFDSSFNGVDQWVTGDFDGDGRTDLAVIAALGGNAGYVHVFYSRGDGTFFDPTKFVFSTVSNAQHVYNTQGVWNAIPCPSGRWALVHLPVPGQHDPNVSTYYWFPASKGVFQISSTKCG